MKKLLLALAIGASISTGASAVTCGINQQPDSTNSYCEDIPITTNYTSVRDIFNQYSPEEKEADLKAGCDQMYQIFLTRLMLVQRQKSLICDAVCKVKKQGYLPLGELSKVKSMPMVGFNAKLKWLAEAVLLEDPGLTNAAKIYNSFSEACHADDNIVIDMYQYVVDTKFGGDVNKMLELLDNPQHY